MSNHVAEQTENEHQERIANTNTPPVRIWSLNVRGLSLASRIRELEEESKVGEHGILLLQETWRKAQHPGVGMDHVWNGERTEAKRERHGGSGPQFNQS